MNYILVTGGLGFIGSHTVVELLQNNYNVIPEISNIISKNPIDCELIFSNPLESLIKNIVNNKRKIVREDILLGEINLKLPGSNISQIRPNNSQFDSNQDMSGAESITAQPTLPTTPSITGVSWLKQNIYYIKGIVITIILVLMIYVAIKFASIIVRNDLLNSFIIRQLKRRETRQQSQAQAQMAEQQAMEMGGMAPVAATNLPNDNNNDNDNNNNDN